MKKTIGILSLIPLLLLTGCSSIGSKAASVTLIYDFTAILSFLLLVGYCCLIRKKDTWFLLLSASVFVANLGYLTLAISGTLEEALLANRLAYLGSVCLPMSMLMIIMNACRLTYRKWFPGLLLGVGTIVFLLAASPGYLNIYYREVSLTKVNGVTLLEKVYGPWHCIYLYYLLTYFAATAAVIAYAAAKKKVESPMHAVILAMVLFINIAVWLLEQLARIDFELLAVSYILSELFLLGISLILQESGAARAAEPAPSIWEESAQPQVNASPAAEPAPSILEEPAQPQVNASPAAEPAPSILEEPAQPQVNAALVAESDESSTGEAACPAENAESEPVPAEAPAAPSFEKRCAFFAAQIPSLTPTERVIYDYYVNGISTREIMSDLNIKENTLKYHNKNIYGKLGVSSRKQLMEIAAALNSGEDA